MSYRKRAHPSYEPHRTPSQVQAHRGSRAKKIDSALKAPIAETAEQWMKQPDRYDLPNIDTPRKKTNKK